MPVRTSSRPELYSRVQRSVSDFYILLWGDVDSLSDEHRWIRIIGERDSKRTSASILEELKNASYHQQLPVSLDELTHDYERTRELIETWVHASPEARRELRRRWEETRAYLQDRAHAFVVLAR